MKDVCGVFYNDQLHIGGGCTGNPKADAMVYAYSPNVDMWKVLPPCPLKWFAMATWNQQLVVIGGKELTNAHKTTVKELTNAHKTTMTNKVASWEKGEWGFSLPPMLIARVSPTVVSYGGYLAVAGGRRGYMGYSVEVLDHTTMQWGQLPAVPINTFPHTSAVCGSKFYLMHQKSGKILYADIPTLVTQKRAQDAINESNSLEDLNESDIRDGKIPPIWQNIPKPPVSPLRIASVGGYLAVFSHGSSGEGNMVIHTYFPETSSWYQVGKFPEVMSNISCFTSPEKKLYIAGGNTINSQYSQKMFQATMISSSKAPSVS
jgi:N-acetylneuraminic acid mutarotase